MLINVVFYTNKVGLLTKIRKNKLMKENPDDYKVCINLAIDNAKQRIKLLESEDRKSVLEEYKEWFSDGLNYHSILLLREDPII